MQKMRVLYIVYNQIKNNNKKNVQSDNNNESELEEEINGKSYKVGKLVKKDKYKKFNIYNTFI